VDCRRLAALLLAPCLRRAIPTGGSARQLGRASRSKPPRSRGFGVRLLKEIAPGVARVAVLRDPTIASGIGQFGAIQSAAPSLRMEASPVDVRDVSEIERDIAVFARSSNGGVIVTASPEASHHRDLIVTLAARHRLPAIYASRYFVTEGGLISYGA
jgi:putative ABC transport system substrate-binding protein